MALTYFKIRQCKLL